MKTLWANPVVRDTALAALAAGVAAAAVYFKAPVVLPVYLAVRAAVAQYVKGASKGDVQP